jgi:hypothetical protein
MTTVLLLLHLLADPAPAVERATMIVVVGAPGAAEYGKQFEQWAERVVRAGEQGGAEVVRIGPGDDEEEEQTDDRARLQAALEAISKESPHPVWIVLLGHGSYDRRTAAFNLRGPDVSADDLAQWLKPLERPVAVINASSCSGPFLNVLAAPGRAIVTATRSGAEQNFARFGDYFSSALADPTADLDKDSQVSLLETFLAASARVEEFYKQENRLATEHALLDDTGDGLGTPASWFRGVRANKAAKEGATIDGVRANQLHLVASDEESQLSPEQRARRDELETALEALRRRKSEMDEADYYAALEEILRPLATLYAASEEAEASAAGR